MPGQSHRATRSAWKGAGLVAGVLLMAVQAHSAGNWVKVVDLLDGDVLYAQAPAPRPDGGTVALTTLLVYGQLQRQGQGSPVQATRAQWELRCADRHYRNLSFSTHAGKTADSPVVDQHAQPSNWSGAPPQSLPGKLLQWVCRS